MGCPEAVKPMIALVIGAMALFGPLPQAFGADLSGTSKVMAWAAAGPARGVAVTALAGAPKRHLTRPGSPALHYLGGAPGRADTGGRIAYLKPVNVHFQNESPPWAVAFTAKLRTFEVSTLATGSDYRFIVDGRATPLRRLPGTWKPVRIRVRFRRPGARLVVFEMGRRTVFGGVTGRVSRSRVDFGPRTIWLGDSYTDGTGATDSLAGYVQVASSLLGLGDSWASGLAGTGYLNAGGRGKVAFGSRLQSDVLAYRPHTVVVAGGINDGERRPDDVRAAAAELFRRIGSSGARLVVIAPWQLNDPPTPGDVTLNAAIRAAAEEAGGLFVATTGWITDANRRRYVGSDGVHPTQAGHEYLGRRVAAAIAAL